MLPFEDNNRYMRDIPDEVTCESAAKNDRTHVRKEAHIGKMYFDEEIILPTYH